LPRRAVRASFLPALESLETRCLPATNVTTFHFDYQSTGANLNETQLTPTTVNPTSFGKLFSTPLNGSLYAQPLVLTNVAITGGGSPGTYNSVVFAATTNDSLFALNASNGAILWQRTFLDLSGNDSLPGATQVTTPPNGPGIVGTPVIDPSANTLYITVNTQETVGGVAHAVFRVHAINIANGTDKVTPYILGDTYGTNGGSSNGTNNTAIYVYGTGDGAVTDPYNGTGKQVVQFSAYYEFNRPAMALVGGKVYVAFASHGDQRPYHGWVIALDVSNLQTNGFILSGVLCTNPNGGGDGVWGGGGGITFEPNASAFYFETGNGFDRSNNPTLDANGFPTDHNFPEALLKAQADPTTTPTNQNSNGWGLKIVDYFTPYNVVPLDNADEDFGSGSPLVLPDSAGIPGHQHLMVAAGKEGKIYLIDRDNLGKFNANADNVLNAVPNGTGQNTPPVLLNGSLSTPAYFQGEIYWVSGYSNSARAFTISSSGSVLPVSQTALGSFGYGPGSLVVSANGTDPATGVVWIVDRQNMQLHAYSALSLNMELWNSGMAAGNALDAMLQFSAPTVANGQVFVSTQSGVESFGLIAPPAQTQPPNAPINLSAQALSGSAVELHWNDTTGSPNFATSYTIQQSTDGINFTTVGTAGQQATNFTVTGLNASTAYSFRVAGSNSAGTSGYSNPPATATTTSQTGQTPTAPVGLGATPAGPASVFLTWVNTASNQTGFTVTRATDSNFTQNVVVQTLAAAPYYYTDTAAGMSPGGTYFYKIQASNSSGLSSSSNTATVTIPQVPPTPTDAAAVQNGNFIDVSWVDHAGPYALGYQIFRGIDGGPLTLYMNLPETSDPPPTTQGFTDTGVVLGHTYAYQIVAHNVSGFSGPASTSISILGTATLSLDGSGNLVYTVDPAAPDRLVVQLSGSNYVVTDPAVTITAAGAGAASMTGSGTSSVTVPASAVTAITLDTGDNSDSIGIVSDNAPITITADSGSGNPTINLGPGTISGTITNRTFAPFTIPGSGSTTITGNLINQGNGGLAISGSGTVSISGNVVLGFGSVNDTDTSSVTISGAISSSSGTGLVSGGLSGNYYAINTNAIPENTFQNNLLDPTVNGNANPNWLGNLTSNQYNTFVSALTPQINWVNNAISGGGGPAGNTGPSFAPIADVGQGNNDIAARWFGSILVPGSGSTPIPVDFATQSDDGSMLYIDGSTVVSNDAFQPEARKTGVANLTPGFHAIDIEFYNGQGGAAMSAYWDPTGNNNFVVIPSTSLFSGSSNSVTKAGTGTLTLAGNNTYVGPTYILGGTLVAASGSALGTTDGGTTVALGAALQFTGGINYSAAEAVTINGSGPTGNGAIENLGGTNSFAGPIVLASTATIGSDTGTLNLSGNIATGGFGLTFSGAGNTSATGVISGSAFSPGLLEGQVKANLSLNGTGADVAPPDPTLGTDITLNAFMAEVAGGNNGSDAGNYAPTTSHIWTGSNTWVYQGQMFVPAPGQIAFAKSIDDDTLLKIDGNVVLSNGSWNTPLGTGVLNLTPGWHNVDFRFANGGGGAGANNGGGGGWSGIYGFGYWVPSLPGLPNAPTPTAPNPAGISNTAAGGASNAQAYIIPVDPGNGTLFRVPSPGITKTGLGTLTLSNSNTYGGATTINQGILIAASNSALGTTDSGTTVAAGATLAFANNINYSTPEAVSIAGAGVGGVGAIGNASGNNSFAGPITLTGDSTIGSSAAGGDTLTLNGNITGGSTSGGFALTFNGAGKTVVNGAITTTGGVPGLVEGQYKANLSLNGTGADVAAPDPSLGTDIVLDPLMGETTGGNNGSDNGNYVATTSHIWTGSNTWIYQGQVLVPASGQVAFAKSIDDDTLVKIDGNVVLSNGQWDHPYGTGVLNLTPGWHNVDIRFGNGGGGAGAVNPAGAGWIGGGNNVVNGGYGFGFWTPGIPWLPSAPTPTAANVNGVSNNGAGGASNGNSYVIPQDNGSGNLFRTGAAATVTKNGTGTVMLMNSGDSYTGGTTVNGGILQIPNDSVLGTSGTAITINAGNLEVQGSLATSRPLSVNSAASTITVDASDTYTVNTAIAGSGTLNKAGAGTLVLPGVNTYSGGTVISQGRVNGKGSSPLGAGTLTLGGGTVSLTAASTAIGLTGYTSDTLWGPGEGSSTAGTSADIDNGGFIFYSSAVYGIPGGGLPANGGFISAANPNVYFQLQPYAGNNDLRLNAGASGTLTMTTPTQYSSLSILDTGGSGAALFNVTLTFTDNSTDSFNSNTAPDWFTGGGGVAIGGVGRATRSTGAPSYSGLPGNPNLYELDLALSAADQGKLLKSITFNNTAAGGPNPVLNVFGVSGFLNQSPVQSYPNNVLVTASSTIDVENGAAALGALSINGSTLNVTTSGGATSLTLGATTLTGSSPAPTFATGTNTTLIVGGLNDGGVASTITKSGAGALTLTSAAASLVTGTVVNILSGTINSNNATALGALASVSDGGILNLGASQTLGALTGGGTVNLNGNTLTVGSTNNLPSSFGGTLQNGSGPGALTKAGTGTFVLTAGSTDTYTGPTTVSAGTLQVDSSLSSSATTVSSGATLDGTSMVGSLSASSGGTVSPGDTGGAIANLGTGNLSLPTGSTYHVDLGLTTSDSLTVGASNTVTLGGTLSLNLPPGVHPALNQVFTLINNTSTNAISGTFSSIVGATNVSGNQITLNNAYVLTLSYTGGANHNSVTLQVTRVPGPIDHFSVVASPTSIVAGNAVNLVVTAFDAGGYNDVTYSGTVHFTSSDSQATVAGDSTLSNGSGTFSSATTLRTAGNQTITAQDSVTTTATGTSNAVTVTPSQAVRFSVTAPSSASPGVAFNFVVSARDLFSNITPAYNGQVTLTSSDGTALLSPNPYTFVPGTDNGTHTFSGTLNTGGVQTISAADVTAQGLTGTSNPITVAAATPTHLVFLSQPTSTTAGATIAPAVKVAVEDAGGNVVLGDSSTVTISLGANPGGGTLGGTVSLAAVNGVAIFTTLSINKVGAGYVLAASDGVLTGAASSAFNILVGTASKVVFSQQPSNTTAGSTISPAVKVAVEDNQGNVVSSDTSTVSVALGANPGSGALSGTASLAAVNGVATFSTLSINRTGSGYTLTAADGTLTGATSSSFNITPGAANHFSVSASPSPTTAGSGFLTIVTAQDNLGNTDTNYSQSVTFTSTPVDNNSAGGNPPAASTPLNAGVGVTIGTLYSAGNYQIIAHAPGNAFTGTSNNIQITAGSVTHFVVASTANPAVTGSPTNVTATAEDNFNNVVTNYTGTITLSSSDAAASFASNPVAFTGGDLGIHTFSTTLNTPGSQTITVKDTSNNTINGTSSAITTRGLEVSSVTVMPYGFNITFNKAFNASVLNLYDGGSNLLGPSDLVLTGANTGGLGVPGVLEGSVVVTSPTTLTFLYTFGVMPDDNYTLVLRSAANAFVDNAGVSLDGNNSGVPGTNYTTSFSTSFNANDVGLVVGSFARGPAQTVSLVVPGSSPSIYYPGLPIQLTDGNNATSASFTLTYNTALLTISGAIPDSSGAYPSAPAGSTFSRTSHTVVSGIATDVFAFHANGSVASGNGAVTIGELQATIPNTANQTIYKAKQVLTVSGVTGLGSLPLVGASAIQVVGYPADASGDGAYAGTDGSLTGRVAGGQDTGFAAWPLVDPVVLADLAGEGQVTATDASQVAQVAVHRPNLPNITPIPAGAQVAPSTAPDPLLSLPTGLRVSANGTVSVPVNLDEARPAGSTGLTEATLALRFDPSVFTVSGSDIQLGSIPQGGNGWTLTSSVNDVTGQIGITLSSLTPITSNVAGSLVTIDFHAQPGAAVGTSSIQLAATVDPSGHGSYVTNVADSNGAMILGIAPTNVANPVLDCTVVVLASPVSAVTVLTSTSVVAAVEPEVVVSVTPVVSVVVESSSGEESSAASAAAPVDAAARTGKTATPPGKAVASVLSQAAAGVFQLGLPAVVAAQVPMPTEQHLADRVFQSAAGGVVDMADLVLVGSAAQDAMSQYLSRQPQEMQGNELDGFRLYDLDLPMDLSSSAIRSGYRQVSPSPVPQAAVSDASALSAYFTRLAADDAADVEADS
jgi:autotransporter-associated beta strand protein